MNAFKESEKPIRILHVVTYMGRGGLETMIMNYYRKMDHDKIQFDFLTHREFKADYDKEIESLGGIIYRLPPLVPWGRKYHKALNHFFKEHPEYKIIHVHQDCLSSVILKVAKEHGIKVRIAHSHSSSQDKNLKYPIKLFYKQFIPKYATTLFACSNDAGDWMFNGAPYNIINNAINAQLYDYNEEQRSYMREQLGIASDAFVIGHVGRFDIVKNHTFLLDILVQIKKEAPQTVLLLTGDGSLRPIVETRANQLNVLENVIFTGIRDDVPKLMQAMDCFVFPSLYEGLPLTLIEAQAAGLPCVASTEVTCESDKTGLVKFISLEEDIDVWIKEILSTKEIKRKSTSEQIICSGFDIVENAKWLQDYYLEYWRELE